MMKNLLFFFCFFVIANLFGQDKIFSQKVSGTIINENVFTPLSNVNVININKVKGTMTDNRGFFEIDVEANDTLHISCIGFKSMKVRVTNDWIKNKTTQIKMTERAIALEEVVVKPYDLTGYLEVDSKLIPLKENYRYSISGLPQGYETGEYASGAVGRVIGAITNPADLLYNVFGKKPAELKRLKQMKKDDTVRNLLASKFDRETLAALIGVDKKEIPEILGRCNYSETFIKTANDLQIMDAISDCYEEYKVLKKK